MKPLLMIPALLVAASALGADDVTVKLNDVSPKGTHTNIWFECTLTIHNGTSTTFFATNLFIAPSGLVLKISDLDGKELKRECADGWINNDLNTAIIPPGDTTFKEPYGLGGGGWPFALPEGVRTVRLKLDGTLCYTAYTNRLASNVVELHVP